jgi:uncharacterized protein YbjT (DUF2867 family)
VCKRLSKRRSRKTQGFRVFPAKRAFLTVFPAGCGKASPHSRRFSSSSLTRLQTLVTGVSGYVGAALVPRLVRDGHAVRGFARSAGRVTVPLDDLVIGDATTGAGLAEALDGVEVAYYLIHSMEGAAATFVETERRQAERFANAAAEAGVRRIVFLGGLLPHDGTVSRHLASRLAVEQALLDAVPESVALRASIVVAARSRSFRFLVRLIERLPVLALPAWRVHRTQPVDGRDVLEFLAGAATLPALHAGRAWDLGGPDAMSYAEMLERIGAVMMVERPALRLRFNLTPVAAVVAAAVAGEDPALIEPLMESLEHDLLPRDGDAAGAFGVRLHGFEAAVERALRDMEEQDG